MEKYLHRRAALCRMASALKRGKITIGFVGGSITDPENNNRWSDILVNWFVSSFPGLIVDVENAAKGAAGSAHAIFRLAKDILNKPCDLIFWECAVNDNEPPHVRTRLREGVLRQLLTARADIVPVYAYSQRMYASYRNNELPEDVQELEALAQHYQLSSVNMGLYGFDCVRSGRLKWEEWLPDGIHPDHYGSSLYAQPVIELLQTALHGDEPARILPAPLYGDDWSGAYTVPWEEVRRIGPWRLNREYRIAAVDRIMTSYSPDAMLEARFRGTGVVVHQKYNFYAADIAYRLDGGDWLRVIEERYDWSKDAKNWIRSCVLAIDLANAEHRLELRGVWGEKECAAGINMEISCIGVLP